MINEAVHASRRQRLERRPTYGRPAEHRLAMMSSPDDPTAQIMIIVQGRAAVTTTPDWTPASGELLQGRFWAPCPRVHLCADAA
jgi:hypothetical protein